MFFFFDEFSGGDWPALTTAPHQNLEKPFFVVFSVKLPFSRSLSDSNPKTTKNDIYDPKSKHKRKFTFVAFSF